MQLSALASQYLKWFASRGASPKTIECYDLSYTQFIAYLLGQGQENDVRGFTPDTVEGFIVYLTEAGRKSSSVNIKLCALHSLGEYGKKSRDARGKYFLAENPLDRVIRPKRQKPAEKYLYLAELRQLVAVECPGTVRVALELLIDTALRASEVASANVSQISLDGDRVKLAVTVKGGSPKIITLGVHVGEMLLESLRFREARPTDPLVVNERGERYTRTTISEMVLRLAKRAGITRILVRAHVLRHSVATLASELGMDVQEVANMLNHSDTSTAQKYIHRRGSGDAARDAVREALR